jgi:hypothetical protein
VYASVPRLALAYSYHDVPNANEDSVNSPYLAPVQVMEVPAPAISYTAFDDASFAVNTRKVSDQLQSNRQQYYDDFIEGCKQAATSPSEAFMHCESEDAWRMQMNTYQPRSVYNYTQTGFLKISAPPRIVRILSEFWKRNKNQAIEEWSVPTAYHNNWESPPTLVKVDNQSLAGGGPHLQAGE